MDIALAGIAPVQAEAGERKAALETVARIRDETWKAVETLAHAVQAAHDKGIVHRDFRISSTTPSPKGARCIQAIASSFDFTWISQKPAISSFDSVKGPPITIFLPP